MDNTNTMDKQDNRAGVGVGIITRGNVSIKWMTHMDKLKGYFPIGMFWKYIIIEDESGWAKNRIKVVNRAQKEKYEWLLFIDDDVFVPRDIMQQFLAHQKDIVTGIYWTKTENETPVIFEKEGAGPMIKFPIDKLFKVAGSGLGCVLINMKVFDAFDKAGIEYFKENWVMELDSGQKIRCPVGEDHYFYHHARKLGFDVWADSGVLCDHYDMENKKFYPSRVKVREVTGQKLVEMGREDLIDEMKKDAGLDKNKKTISFVNFTLNPFCGDELEKRGVGGAETDIINLSKIFANDYDFNVHVFCNCPKPGVYDNVIYHDIESQIAELSPLNSDLLITSRNTKIFNKVDFKNDFNAKKVALWCHDMSNDPVFDGFKYAYPSIDKIFALTDYHKKDIQKTFPFAKDEKFFLARNGVDMNRFKDQKTIEKIPGRLIYSSTPFRGLDVLTEVFPEIRKRVPYVTLNVFSSMAVYGNMYDEEEFGEMYRKLRNMEGVTYSGSITQDKLAVEQMKAELLAYPNTYPETSCITVMECQAAGTPVVTSAYAALNETVPEGTGIRLEGKPHSDEYKKEFVDAIIELLTNKEKWQKMSDACLALDVSWTTIADEWIKEFFPEQSHDAPEDVDSIKQVGNVNTEEYWDKLYQDEFEHNYIREDTKSYDSILKDFNGGKLLDIGCGTGAFTREVRNRFPDAEIWGSDFSMKAIDYCRQQNRTIFYANHPLLNKNYEKNYFDMITMNHIIEHIDNPKELIKHAKTILKQDGTLILTMPLDDDEWHEHLKVWHYNDIVNLLDEFECEYIFEQKTNTEKRYKDGRLFKEIIVKIKFV